MNTVWQKSHLNYTVLIFFQENLNLSTPSNASKIREKEQIIFY
jgi:hypothetical protein